MMYRLTTIMYSIKLITLFGAGFFTVNTHGQPVNSRDQAKQLEAIDYYITLGSKVDMNLNKIQYSEKCSITYPGKERGNTLRTGLYEKISSPFESSNFVSCRYVVDNPRIGAWNVCGQPEEANAGLKRCRTINIFYRDAENKCKPETTEESVYTVKKGSYQPITLTISDETMDYQSCHVVTPQNEDLIIKDALEYPNIKLAPGTDSAECNIVITPDESYIGNWTVYGIHESFLGCKEIRKPVYLTFASEDIVEISSVSIPPTTEFELSLNVMTEKADTRILSNESVWPHTWIPCILTSLLLFALLAGVAIWCRRRNRAATTTKHYYKTFTY